MTTIAPPKLLRGFLVFKGYDSYISDASSPINGKAKSWQYDIKVYPSTTSYPGIRNDYQYNALDINVGDWISSSVGGFAVQITSIIGTPTTNKISVIVEDIDNYNALGDSTGNGNGAPNPGNCFIFEVNENNKPILTPEFSGVFASTYGVDIISRFEYTSDNSPEQVAIELKNIKINWTTKNIVNKDSILEFTIPTGPDFFIYGVTVSSPLTLECHQTSLYNDTNPYKFIAIDNQLIDDGTYTTSGTKYYGPRYIFLQNIEDRTSNNSYWKLTNNGDDATINIIFNISTYKNLKDQIIIFDNA